MKCFNVLQNMHLSYFMTNRHNKQYFKVGIILRKYLQKCAYRNSLFTKTCPSLRSPFAQVTY